MERKDRNITEGLVHVGIAGALVLGGVVGYERLAERFRPTNYSLISELRAPIPSEIHTFDTTDHGRRVTWICFGHPSRPEYPGGFGSCGTNAFNAFTHFLQDEADFDSIAINGPQSLDNSITINSQTGANTTNDNGS